MKKHIKNKKAIGAIVIGAAVLSVGSVGFASWIIAAQNVGSSTEAIGVQVAEVVDKSFTLSNMQYENTVTAGANNVDSDKTLVDATNNKLAYVVFGPKGGDNAGMIQASGNDVNDIGHLKVQFSFVLSGLSLGSDLASISITPAYGSLLGTLATDGYIVNPSTYAATPAAITLYNSTNDGVISTTTNPQNNTASGNSFTTKFENIVTDTNGVVTSAKVIVTAVWNWGSKFGTSIDNPSVNDSDASVVANHVTNLTALNKKIGDETTAANKQVKFTVTAVAKTPAA